MHPRAQGISRRGQAASSHYSSATGGRMLLEVDNRVFNIRPDRVDGVDITDSMACESRNFGRFLELEARIEIHSHSDLKYRMHTGMSMDEVRRHFPVQAKRLTRCHAGVRRHEAGGQFTGPAYRHLFVDAVDSVLPVDGCSFEVRIDSHPRLDVKGSEFLDLGEIAENAPIIARSLYFDCCGGRLDFEFIRFLGEGRNNTVALVRNSRGERFIVKHLWLKEPIERKQSYPKVFKVLASIRQAALDRRLLSDIGTDIGVRPVVSHARVACVEVRGLPYRELAFFKMVPFVEGKTLREWLDMDRLGPGLLDTIIGRIARYLARLHTVSFDICVLRKTGQSLPNVSVARLHDHPHFGNWLFHPSKPDVLHLIDWDWYAAYGNMPSCFPMAHTDLDSAMLNMPAPYRPSFAAAYLKEWEERATMLRADDRQQAVDMLKAHMETLVVKHARYDAMRLEAKRKGKQ